MAHLFDGPVSVPEGEDGAVGRVVAGPCSVCNLPWDDPVHFVFEGRPVPMPSMTAEEARELLKRPAPAYDPDARFLNPIGMVPPVFKPAFETRPVSRGRIPALEDDDYDVDTRIFVAEHEIEQDEHMYDKEDD